MSTEILSNIIKAATEMAQLVCAGCHTLLMYMRGATSVQCSCCHTINLALEGKNYPIDSVRLTIILKNIRNHNRSCGCVVVV